ncbi:SGNH/GDSL hydrolase family protein [Streptomyces griseiscabiei]|uniref:SGNH/GDSL hydrolase family protein n=1 Tax=Streptomyces griseiscabiei TaxID=2993540 RepID=A0ABU4KXB1_9ACTN|nr:SGNH/GDSL hydrolase family protein [Streptomyces griseiscabiei]MBZ3900463.1 SGNH/GDSL hydrolase family protein [Streptomyces griseiscabiei]MDX2907778.1 SGNH/GDSL hydrolase family protein [Streptomyces griseiscabiei]
MRKRRHRSRAVFGAVSAGVSAVLLLAVTGCDATGGDSPGPEGTGSRARPSVSPSPTPAWDTTPESLVAVGDSITRGFDACKVLSDCPEVSWATGTDASVDSLAVRLLGASGAASRSWNYAVTGARMADLPSQVARAVTRRPELVTVMVGANDACRASAADMTPVADFRADFEDSMATLRDSLPKAQVFVASVPDLKRLWSEGRKSPMGKQVWKLGICPSMLADPDALTTAAGERRDAVQDRVEAYNDVLREVCEKDRYCRYDEDAVFDYRFGRTQLSQWDWFHPSVDGQARLAEIAYRVVSAKQP